MNSFLRENISLTNLKRLNFGWKYILGLSVLLLFTSDVFNIVNNVWDEYPSQYYVFLAHLLSIPLFIALYKANLYFINTGLYKNETYSRWMMAINVVAFIPFIGTYFYWDLKDYNSSGVYLIYLFIYSFLMRLPKKDNIFLFIYFTSVYFGFLYYFAIAYIDNPSLYLNGIATLFICYGINRALYRKEIQRNINLWKINRKNNQIHDLNLKLKKNNAVIKKQNDEISAINISLENYAGIAAHDIKAPLSTLHSYLEFLSDKYGNILSKEEQEQQNMMLKTSNNLSKLVDSLFQFSKLKYQTDELEKIDLNEIITEALVMLDSSIKEKSAKVTVQKNIPEVRGFKELTQHLMLNILNNAIKFSKPGVNPCVEIKFQEYEDYIILEIKDNGIGIPEAHHQEIFDIFKRLNEENYEGNGIGLGNSKKIMNLQNGEIWVESKVGKGSSFFILFLKNTRIIGKKNLPGHLIFRDK